MSYTKCENEIENGPAKGKLNEDNNING